MAGDTRFSLDSVAPGPGLPGSGLSWLNALRQDARGRFDAKGFPSPRDEEWKYTNVAAIERRSFKPAIDGIVSNAVAPDTISRYRLDDAWSLVLVDGVFRPDLSTLGTEFDGLSAGPLSSALAVEPERLKATLGHALAAEPHGFLAYNTAFFAEGLYLRVARGSVIERPIQVLNISTQGSAAVNLRNLYVLEPGSRARVVETFVGQPESGALTVSVSEALVAEGAELGCTLLQNESERGFLFSGLYATIGRDARLGHDNLSLGGLLVRNEIHVSLDANSSCSLNGLFVGRNRRHVDNHTLIHHHGPNGVSREQYRGILADRSRGVFQGRIVVHPDAQKTDAQMNNRNLLLSDDAEVDTKPQLEIHADDVKCAHGVAIGQLDPESVFYLESRGIDSAAARNMLSFAFANAMIEQLELTGVRNLARDELLAQFPQSGIRKDWL
ncbi:MAG: Fe-S cluster assembly protein SufD [Methylotetracoccus sp.]